MNTLEACRQRKSIRAFSDAVPDKKLILQCLDAAAWAPNPTSQQPWQFIVVTGTSLQAVSAAIAENFAAAQAGRAGPDAAPASGSAALLAERRRENFEAMVVHLKKHRVDMQALGEGNFNFHRAPMAVLFATYPCKDQNYLKSTVAAMQNFLLAAFEAGLGTCWMNAVSICQEAVKKALHLPVDLILVDGVAVGYPVQDAPLNSLPRRRLPIQDVVEWLT